MKAVIVSGIRLRQTQPQIGVALLAVAAVEVQPRAVAALIVQPGIGITFLSAFHACR
ncbi:hypothetical protein GGER_19660 [Serratia rubidaea]